MYWVRGYGHGPLKICFWKGKDDDHDQDFLKKDLLHIWLWSFDKSSSKLLRFEIAERFQFSIYPLTQNHYLRKIILKISNFTRNFWKESFFPGDLDGATSLKIYKKNIILSEL